MLQIAPTKVGRVIVLAREFDVKTAPWDDASPEERDEDPTSVLEAVSNDPVVAELRGLIDGLNVDEQVSLVALMWIGRGTYEADDLEEAMSMARSERVNETSDYLLGVPLLPDYLEEGLSKLGHSPTDLEDENM